ncbi:type II toxin-antitoxin system VapC family toxin [Methylobacterium haplocladii]|uniref:Ribonuclease VapC n=1 Tax=Methylobacterium haplocladii TaxID=1176176 RepID=A0A512IMP3_9HYPH|nr:type II toxin-antitoxin system VapC family toxin [Methylobacterium haplocladii]GEO98974.1 ribonuclease VapC [Methylobacterium haplocladii]GJD84179.1 Toxin FitB [Methylobacterium haplocladii]GLS60315.1 ribonuclease VapC [Methylobacterium haplocladii]
MIVLDTNVIAELMRGIPNERVLAWIGDQPSTGLFTTTLTQAEVFYGLSLLPTGRRRTDLVQFARPIFETDFAGRVLPFDSDAALAYAEIAAERRRAGRPISQIDGQIAAIVRSRGARLATRSTRDFLACGITLVDPWAAG